VITNACAGTFLLPTIRVCRGATVVPSCSSSRALEVQVLPTSISSDACRWLRFALPEAFFPAVLELLGIIFNVAFSPSANRRTGVVLARMESGAYNESIRNLYDPSNAEITDSLGTGLDPCECRELLQEKWFFCLCILLGLLQYPGLGLIDRGGHTRPLVIAFVGRASRADCFVMKIGAWIV